MRSLNKLLLLILFVTGCVHEVYAQGTFVARRNDNAATIQILSNGQLGALALDQYGKLFITSAADTTTVTGNLNMTSTASAVSINTSGQEVLTVQYNRTTETGTIVVEATNNGGVTWVSLPVVLTGNATRPEALNIALFSSARANISGYTTARVRVFSGGTGTLAITITTSSGSSGITSSVYPGTGAAELGKQRNTATGTSDVGVGSLFVRNQTVTNLSVTEGNYSPGAVGTFGNALSSLIYDSTLAGGLQVVKLEDSAAASSDALVGVAGVSNVNQSSLASDGDYTALATDTRGNVATVPIFSSAGWRANNQATGVEDQGVADGNAGMKVLVLTQDPLSVDQGASEDLAFAKVDRAGRTITTPAPAGESFQNCSAAATDTSTIDIKAAVASNRIYVTSLSCVNTSAVASMLNFRDGAAIIHYGGVGTQAANGGIFTQTFPVPLRGSINTALRFNVVTTGTNTFCCAAGYISVY